MNGGRQKNQLVAEITLRQAGETTDMTTSHLTKPLKRQVIGYSHSTKLSNYDSKVAGYQGERICSRFLR